MSNIFSRISRIRNNRLYTGVGRFRRKRLLRAGGFNLGIQNNHLRSRKPHNIITRRRKIKW